MGAYNVGETVYGTFDNEKELYFAQRYRYKSNDSTA